MEEACQVSVASNICSINILVHGNVKLGGKNTTQSSVQHSTLHRRPLCWQFPWIELKGKIRFKVTSCPFAVPECPLLSRDFRQDRNLCAAAKSILDTPVGMFGGLLFPQGRFPLSGINWSLNPKFDF